MNLIEAGYVRPKRTKTCIMNFRATEELQALIVASAMRNGNSVSDEIRSILEKSLNDPAH